MKTAVALLLLSVAIASTHHFAMEDSNSEESFGCACPRINDPVCGSNGVTYGNSCELKCQQQVHPGLTEASKGECQEKAVCTCPRILRPVCGTDGQTYSNKCLLDCQTKKNPEVKVSYNGNCREHSQPQVDPMPQPQVDPMPQPQVDPMPQPQVDLMPKPQVDPMPQPQVYSMLLPPVYPMPPMPQNNAQQKPAVCACPRILRPVCGTDGQTYSNKCLLDCQTQKNPDVKLSYNGNCRALSQPQEDPMPQSRIDPMFQPQVDPMPQPQTDPMPMRSFVCRCPKILRPVCGTDGATYSNQCLLNCQAKKNPDLKTSYDGPCEDKLNQFPEGNECICPMNFAPVCGSDGQTYSNKCLLQCESTKDRNLRYEYNGPCQPMVSSSPDVMH